MATLSIALTMTGKTMSTPVLKSAPRVSAYLATSASSQADTHAALDGEYWDLATNGDVWVAFGATPTAAKGTGYFMPAGTVRNFEAVAGDKVAVIDNS